MKTERKTWTNQEVRDLAKLMQAGGKSIDEVAEALGISRERVSAKASQLRAQAKARGVELPKFRVVRKASSEAKELFDSLFGGGEEVAGVEEEES